MAKTKEKSYIRNDIRLGIHTVCLDKGRAIRITDGQIYTTSKKTEIKVLDADPGVTEYTTEPTEEEKEEQEKKDEKKRKKEAEAKAEKEKKDAENDPGEDGSNLDLLPATD